MSINNIRNSFQEWLSGSRDRGNGDESQSTSRRRSVRRTEAKREALRADAKKIMSLVSETLLVKWRETPTICNSCHNVKVFSSRKDGKDIKIICEECCLQVLVKDYKVTPGALADLDGKTRGEHQDASTQTEPQYFGLSMGRRNSC